MSAENFERAARFTMAHEGGAKISDHAADPGGLTKYGISQKAYPGLDIRALTEERALDLYCHDYWDKIRGDELPWPVDLALFDYAFNSGPNQAIRDLQECLGLTVDGILGRYTLAAVRRNPEPALVARDLNARRLIFLSGLAFWSDFALGWTRRVLDLQRAISV